MALRFNMQHAHVHMYTCMLFPTAKINNMKLVASHFDEGSYLMQICIYKPIIYIVCENWPCKMYVSRINNKLRYLLRCVLYIAFLGSCTQPCSASYKVMI